VTVSHAHTIGGAGGGGEGSGEKGGTVGDGGGGEQGGGRGSGKKGGVGGSAGGTGSGGGDGGGNGGETHDSSTGAAPPYKTLRPEVWQQLMLNVISSSGVPSYVSSRVRARCCNVSSVPGGFSEGLSIPVPTVDAHTSALPSFRSIDDGTSSVSGCIEYEVTYSVSTPRHSTPLPPAPVSKSKKAIRNFGSTYGVLVPCSTKVN
jgi:hypothetical protein